MNFLRITTRNKLVADPDFAQEDPDNPVEVPTVYQADGSQETMVQIGDDAKSIARVLEEGDHPSRSHTFYQIVLNDNNVPSLHQVKLKPGPRASMAFETVVVEAAGREIGKYDKRS